MARATERLMVAWVHVRALGQRHDVIHNFCRRPPREPRAFRIVSAEATVSPLTAPRSAREPRARVVRPFAVVPSRGGTAASMPLAPAAASDQPPAVWMRTRASGNHRHPVIGTSNASLGRHGNSMNTRYPRPGAYVSHSSPGCVVLRTARVTETQTVGSSSNRAIRTSISCFMSAFIITSLQTMTRPARASPCHQPRVTRSGR